MFHEQDWNAVWVVCGFYRRYFVAAIYYSVVDWVLRVVGF